VKHRLPPKPIYYDNACPGQCRFCGDMIVFPNGKIKTRANWHPHCLEVYKTIYWPTHTRKVVWKRDQGQCAGCHMRFLSIRGAGSEWHVDHIRPLFEANGDLEFWRLPNLQVLCIPCHNKKSALEARYRAELRRMNK
jgi:5-methylcytosine-specific restriction endonuclease McrA